MNSAENLKCSLHGTQLQSITKYLFYLHGTAACLQSKTPWICVDTHSRLTAGPSPPSWISRAAFSKTLSKCILGRDANWRVIWDIKGLQLNKNHFLWHTHIHTHKYVYTHRDIVPQYTFNFSFKMWRVIFINRFVKWVNSYTAYCFIQYYGTKKNIVFEKGVSTLIIALS